MGKHFEILILLVLTCYSMQRAAFADWPEYRGNQQRTSFRSQELAGKTWQPFWQFKLPAPRSSWDKPARGSIWQNLTSIEPRVTDDRANVPLIVVDKNGTTHVLIPSSTDDRLISLDPNSGRIQWQIETDAPVRFTPAVSNGVAYFGSDDGFLRAADLENGKVLWKKRVGPEYKSILGNGRLISPHPIRTSVVVQDKLVIAHAGLFPSQGAYAVALRQTDGQLVWRRQIDASSQGYLLGTGKDRVYVPTGRSVPYAIDSSTGNKLYDLPSPGGTFCMLTPEVFFAGPGNSPTIESFSNAGRAKMLSFQARHIAAGDGRIWTGNGSRITCHDLKQVARKQQTPTWQVESKSQNGLIVSGQKDHLLLFAAGPEEITCIDASSGRVLKKLKLDKALGEVVHLAVSEATQNCPEILVASTSTGHVLAWRASLNAKSENASDSRLFNPASPSSTNAAAKTSSSYKDSVKGLKASVAKLVSKHGYALVAGKNHHASIQHLLDETSLKIVALVGDESTLAESRRHYRQMESYGSRVTVIQVTHLNSIPIEPGLFNLVINLKDSGFKDDVIKSMACAGTGVFQDSLGNFAIRKSLRGQGSWRHQYADPSNLSDAKDVPVGSADHFKLKWFGGVGPSRMPDRHLRGPAPLCAGSAMIVQADGALIGVDPANGTERWQYKLPQGSMRYVTPYDGGYVCLNETGTETYLAAKSQLIRLNSFTGRVLSSTNDLADQRWGYLSQGGKTVVASRMKMNAPRVATDRKTQRTFVDADYRSERPLVCSRTLHGLSLDFATRWHRPTQGVIPNGSIAVDYQAGLLVFVEGRSTNCLQHPTDRIPTAQIFEDAFLVAVDCESGKPKWERKINWPEAKNILYTQITPQGVLLTTSISEVGKAKYYFRMHASDDGRELWQVKHAHVKGGLYHGEQVHHPLVLKRPDGVTVLVAEPYFYDLKTGQKIIPYGKDENWAIRRPGHSCGTLSGSGNCLFFRANNPTVLNLNSSADNKFTALSPSRPGCWINIIPAGGNLLIPEASASCVCKYSLQTSMCFRPIPKERVDAEISFLPDVVPDFQAEPLRLIHHWARQKDHHGNQLLDLVGNLNLQGTRPLKKTDQEEIVFDGKQWFSHQLQNPTTPSLPKTVSLDVVVTLTDAPEWCGLLGAIQDNGSYERGCLLGIHNQAFFLAIASENSGKLTYLRSDQKFKYGKRYHVTGTYDGRIMRLFVDGKQVNQSETQSGPIFYDRKSWFTLGAYKDSSELHIMKGSIREARVYQGAMPENQVKLHFQSLIQP